MKSKSFFKGLSWLLILNIVIKPVWIFAIDRQVQNTLGNEAYGKYFALLNLSIVLLFIADAGLSNMMTQRIAGRVNTAGKQLLQLKLVLLLAYVVVCVFAGWMTDITEWATLLYVLLIQSFASLFLFMRSFLLSQQLFKIDAFFSVADKALVSLLCAFFIYGWWQPIRLETFLQLQLFSILLACVFLFVLLIKKKLIVDGHRENLLRVLKSTAPFAAIILLMSMQYRIDGFLLERIRTDGALQAGIYASAYRLLDAANMPGYLAASFLVPFIARNKNENELVQKVVGLTRHGLMLLALAVSSFAFVFAPIIQQMLYHTNRPFNNNVIQLCMAVLPAYYLTHVYGSVLTAFSGFKSFITILVISVLVNVGLNFVLIPRFGAMGSCIAALVSQYCCALGCFYYASKEYAFSTSLKPWFTYLAAAIVSLLTFALLKNIIHSIWIILALTALLIALLIISRFTYFKTLFRSFIH